MPVHFRMQNLRLVSGKNWHILAWSLEKEVRDAEILTFKEQWPSQELQYGGLMDSALPCRQFHSKQQSVPSLPSAKLWPMPSCLPQWQQNVPHVHRVLFCPTGMLPGLSWPIPTGTTPVIPASACAHQDRTRRRKGECQ